MSKRSSYGSWVGAIEHDEPDSAPAAQDVTTTTESATPATDRAQGQFGLYAIVSLLLGFVPGLQALWVFTGLCLLALLVSPTVGHLEASAYEEARTNGGGGCQVAMAGVILLGLATLALLVGLAMAGGS
jgi:hypothetical protein